MARRHGRRGDRLLVPLLFVGVFGLTGCLSRPPAGTPTLAAAIATVPSSFFVATPALALPPVAPRGRFTLGQVAVLPVGDPRAAYAAPTLGASTKALQIALRVEGLPNSRPPDVSYELVTAGGVFVALADGEWERASADGGAYRAEGTLLFILPRDLHNGRLDIVDYYYPRLDQGTGSGPTPVAPPLVRRVLASFALDRLP